MKPRTPVHGLMVEFEAPEEVLEATRRAWQAGYREMDAYTPYPVEGLPAELGMKRTGVPFIVLAGGFVGASAGFFMQYWAQAVNYPMNSGGRPYLSWPTWIPPTFEMLILLAAFSALFGMLFLSGLPRPYHPVLRVPRFTEYSQERYFLCIEATDPEFDMLRTWEFLAALQPQHEVLEVPH